MNDEEGSLESFSGCVRLFPLPNLVLFPGLVQPLHIFEPRYRQMTADALSGDKLIGMVLLQPGWESDYAGRPAVYPVGCLGQIVADQSLPDGGFNILLRGLSRMRVEEETPRDDKLYRLGRARLLHDESAPGPAIGRKLRRRLQKSVPAWLHSQSAVLQEFRKLIKSELPLGPLCDILSFALPLDVALKQELLQELHVESRVRQLLQHLEKCEPERKFPPEFSVN